MAKDRKKDKKRKGETKSSREAFCKIDHTIPALQTVPMPADAISGDYISAGWILSQMDVAGGIKAFEFIKGRAVTVGVQAMSFHKPVFIGDRVSVYTDIAKVGNTSLTMKIESWAQRRMGDERVMVTEGEFTFVSIDEHGKPLEIKKAQELGKNLSPGRILHRPASYDARDEKETTVKSYPAIVPPDVKGMVLSTRTVPLPKDTNYLGDIFGGWLLAQMDMAALKEAEKYSGRRVATVGLDAMTFHKPVFVGDEVSFYTQVEKVGNTSISIHVESWAFRQKEQVYEKVTEGTLTYVALDRNRQPLPVKRHSL